MRKKAEVDLTMLRLFRKRAWYAQGGNCYHCHKPVPLAKITADHLTPRYQGGMTRHDNIVASCFPCNNQRNTETNRMGGVKLSSGEGTFQSPFAVLLGRTSDAR